jgi:uncharacterized protein (DUF488 family)
LEELLTARGVTLLVDVRTVPRSRRNPQFDRDAFAKTLRATGIAYRHEPALGGFRRPRADSRNTAWRNAGFRGYADHMETREFAQRLEELEEQAGQERLAVMCAEAVPWRCHRMLLADALTARGIDVFHILGRGRDERHAMTPYARVEARRVTYPGLV